MSDFLTKKEFETWKNNLNRKVNVFTSALTKNYAYLTLSADQNNNLTAGNEVEFDTADTVGITFNTVTHQATLLEGHTYVVAASIQIAFSGAGEIRHSWYDVTNAAYIGRTGMAATPSAAVNSTPQSIGFVVIKPTGSDIVIEYRCVAVDLGTPANIRSGRSWGFIMEL